MEGAQARSTPRERGERALYELLLHWRSFGLPMEANLHAGHAEL